MRIQNPHSPHFTQFGLIFGTPRCKLLLNQNFARDALSIESAENGWIAPIGFMLYLFK
jgi:hypothetical protein